MNQEEYNIIYKEYYNRIKKFAYYYTLDDDEQKDLVQDIFYHLFLALPNYKHKASLGTFIFAIARNRGKEFIKGKIKERKVLQESLKMMLPQEINVENIYLQKEELNFFLSQMQKLPEEYKEVFYLKEVEGFKYREIAKILNLPLGTIKSRLNRAKVMIVKSIEALEREDKNYGRQKITEKV